MTMSSAPSEANLPELASNASSVMSKSSYGPASMYPCDYLRSLKWRVNLNTLTSFTYSSIDDLRRVIADSRRRYAGLRRCLLVDPHFHKGGMEGPDLIVDNPLSQNPDSLWGRFFRSAELEKMVDQDLSRLYPEHGSYFQTSACQALLRRILLLWCLRHPEYGYRQGMHELLAPLLYVLHIDVQHISQVRELYEDAFADKFDGITISDGDHNFSKSSSPVSSKWASKNDDDFQEEEVKPRSSLDDLDPEIRAIVLLSDAYGAEGELGIVLSKRFMEHDAYCMFDALMTGAGGMVAMASFFSPSPAPGSITGLPAVIEASSALYHLLSTVDSSLYSHLVEIGVEPQYFSLRWLRLLFGREFSLENLLTIWDEIFLSPNSTSAARSENGVFSQYMILTSPRGAFIIAMAVSMLLHLRASLLASENATSCLQRLLNFPQNMDLGRLVEKAKSLQALALDASMFSSLSVPLSEGSKPTHSKGYSTSSDSSSPRTPLNLLRESYWEEKWRVLHRAEDVEVSSSTDKPGGKQISGKSKLRIARAGSVPSSPKNLDRSQNSRFHVRRKLLGDLSRDLDESEPKVQSWRSGESSAGNVSVAVLEGKCSTVDPDRQNDSIEEICSREPTTNEECYPISSALTSPCSIVQDPDGSLETSQASNICISDAEDIVNNVDGPCASLSGTDNTSTDESVAKIVSNCGSNTKPVTNGKDRRSLSSKFQWLWKFTRNNTDSSSDSRNSQIEDAGAIMPNADRCNSPCGLIMDPEKEGDMEGHRLKIAASDISKIDPCRNLLSLSSAMGTLDKNVMASFRDLGHSMLENIQVIESVFQQEGGHVTAVAALKELRMISHVLSEI